MRNVHRATAISIAALSLGSISQAQSITPSSFSDILAVGGSVTIHKTITLPKSGANLVDLFFLADNTGSMGSIIGNAQSGAGDILAGLPSGISYNFGVGHYVGDPSEGVPPTTSFAVDDPLGASSAAAATGIGAWTASGGGDTPEGNFFALQQTASTTPWRTGSQRLIVWFGDAPSHTETTTQAEALAALNAAGATVIGFNSGASATGLDQDGQASAITGGTGGSLTNDFASLSPADFDTAVNSAISTATSTLNLAFGSDLAGSGLTLMFTCTDLLGCDGVAGGESRTFDLTIVANTPGTYDFSTFASGVDAKELDHIVVTTATPEPATLALLTTGLLGLGLVARKRKSESV